MLFSTFYFSGTGNTKWVVEQFNHIVIQNGHEAKLYSIDKYDEYSNMDIVGIVRNSSFIGFANPIYGANIPPIMKNFIDYLTKSMKEEGIYSKPVYSINSYGYVNAFGPFEAKKLFDKDCFMLRAYANIKMCNNISTHRFKSKLITDKKMHARKKRAVRILEKLHNRLLLSKKFIRGIGPYLLPGFIIRKKSMKAITNNYKSLSVQVESCNKCMVCVNMCPAHCIYFNGQQFEFSDKCTSCMRCYNFCPTSSVLIDGIFTNPNEYFRYRGTRQQEFPGV